MKSPPEWLCSADSGNRHNYVTASLAKQDTFKCCFDDTHCLHAIQSCQAAPVSQTHAFTDKLSTQRLVTRHTPSSRSAHSKLLEKRQTSGNHEREQLQQHGDQVTCCGRQQCQQPQGILLLLMLFTFLKSAAVMLAPNMRKWSMHGTSLDGTCSAQICMSTLARLRSRTQYSTSRRAAYLPCARRGVQKQPLSHKPSCSCRVCQCCFLAPCSMDVDKAAGEWS